MPDYPRIEGPKFKTIFFSQKFFQNIIFLWAEHIFGTENTHFWGEIFLKKIQFFNIASNWHNEP